MVHRGETSRAARLPAPTPGEDSEAEPARQEVQWLPKWGCPSDRILETHPTPGACSLGQKPLLSALPPPLDSRFWIPKTQLLPLQNLNQACKAGLTWSRGRGRVNHPFSLLAVNHRALCFGTGAWSLSCLPLPWAARMTQFPRTGLWPPSGNMTRATGMDVTDPTS